MSNLLVNAMPIEVTYRDGQKETLNLGELSIRKLYVFIKHLGGSDTPSLVALSAGKPVEWVDTLSDASFDALTTEAIKLNFTRAVARAKSDPVAAAMLAPLALSFASVLRSQQTLGSFGNDLSPAPAASESVAETGNGSSTSRPAGLTPS